MAISLIPAASAVSGTLPAANLPIGSVLQVVQGTTNTAVTSALTSYTDTGLTASITPKFATSKILVIVHQNGVDKETGSVTNAVQLTLLRGASEILMFSNYTGYTGTDLRLLIGSTSVAFLDSPATTSSTTYKTQFRNKIAASVVAVQSNSGYSTITLMEIAA